ncbi:hypothetical protein GALMADRAFT_925136 [Galerina marginata CBS 339.88]|uniref:Cytochrome P450 n=1 Tax=Galerina marginata (strain CBS 339.88) TaxID=685588 RepID=A0A067SR02_GALM3|nr:hypothetical protein GALMADRAFT_925136 [Galerina marginata CBS 339.88]
MPVLNGFSLWVFVATLAIAIVVYVKHSKRSALPYPPGPRKLPILGNLLDFPTSLEWETYARWAKKYNSNCIHLNVAGNDIVVLNSFDVAVELFEKRSSAYSSRPHLPMICDLMGWTWAMSLMPYGEVWRESRRVFTQYFQGSNASLYQAPQMEFVRKMLPRLLDAPEDFLAITRHTVGGTAVSMAYGFPIHPTDDPFINLAEQAVASAGEAAMPGAFLVDILPILKYVPEFVPGTGFQKKAREWRKLQEDLRQVPFDETIRNMALGTARPSFTSISLQNLDESADRKHQEEVIRDTAAAIFVGGADTTLAGINTLFAAMLHFPEAQRKAQEELDRVLGGRLPEFSDEADLPYISAVVKEIQRWRPTLPMAVPRCTVEDDVYEGYHIPKGSIVIPNVWAMLHDEEQYPDPYTFKPERFMKDGKLDPSVRNPAMMAFGFGRRVCPGSDLALSFLWLMVATILATFEVSKAVDDEGRPIEPSVQYQSGLVYRPIPFECTLKARSKAAEDLIRSAADSY